MTARRVFKAARLVMLAFAAMAIWPLASAQSSCTSQGFRPGGDYGKVALSVPQSILNTASAGLGTLDPVSRYAQNDEYRLRSRPIGRLDVRLSNQCMQTCTATLMPGGHIITAGHCFAPRNTGLRPLEARVVFNHLLPEDLQADVEIYSVRISSVDLLEPIEVDGETLFVDIAIAALDLTPTQIEAALLAETIPERFASLYMVGHPLGLPKMIALAGCRVESISLFRLFHRCDTVGGSSGSAFFDTKTQQILGIHTDGSGGGGVNNSGWLMAGVVSQIRDRYGDQFFEKARIEPEPLTASRVSGADTSGLQAAILAFDRRDWPTALALLRRLGDGDDPYANAYLGRMLTDGLGVMRDDREALRRYRRAANKGNAIGQFGVGQAYDTGRGAPANPDEAMRWYRLSAEQGYAPAQTRLASLYGELMNAAIGAGGDPSEPEERMFALLRAAAEQDYLPAINEISFRLSWKSLSVADAQSRTRLQQEALAYTRIAARLDDAAALQALVQKYASGTGVRADGLIARDYFLKSLAAGRAFANFGLGMLYFEGAPGLAIDYVRARQYFEASRDAHASASMLGLIYFEALGVRRDHRKALEYYLFAARRSGQPPATYFNISAIYQRGIDGVSADKVAAFQWALWGLEASLFLSDPARMEARYRIADAAYRRLNRSQRRLAIEKACIEYSAFRAPMPGVFVACPGQPPVGPTVKRYSF